MILSIILNVSVLLSSVATTLSFVPNHRRSGVVYAETSLKMADAPGRRESLRIIRDGALASSATLSILTGFRMSPANADPVTDKLDSPRALRDLRKTKKQLEDAEFYAVENDYVAIATTLQKPPFSEFRKNSRVLIRVLGEDTPEREAQQKKYDVFIARVEALNALAGRGLRGKKEDTRDAYAAVLSGLEDFLELAGKMAEMPLQYNDVSSSL